MWRSSKIVERTAADPCGDIANRALASPSRTPVATMAPHLSDRAPGAVPSTRAEEAG